MLSETITDEQIDSIVEGVAVINRQFVLDKIDEHYGKVWSLEAEFRGKEWKGTWYTDRVELAAKHRDDIAYWESRLV